MVTNTEMDSVIPDLTTADRQYLVADGAARSIGCDGGLQVWGVSTAKRYAAIRQREKEKRYGYGSRARVRRVRVRVEDLRRQRVAMLNATYGQAVRAQMAAERGACAAAGLRAQGPCGAAAHI
eukprot:g6846.t1